MHTKFIFGLGICAVGSFLAGCQTGYNPDGFGGGYSDFMVAPDTARVTIRGNDMTSPQRVFQLMLHRCADLTLQHGFRYFSAETWDDESSTESINLPGSINSDASVSGVVNGNTFNATGTEYSTVRPPSTVNLNRPAGGVTIKMGNNQAALETATGHRVFDASFVFSQMR
jgi:hypothetical protein